MTVVRPASSPARERVEVVTDDDRPALEQLVAADPLVNVVVDARLAAYRSLESHLFGGRVFGLRDASGGLRAAVFHGGNLLPIGGAAADWSELAGHVARGPRLCTSIVGSAAAVRAMWTVLEPRWGRARAVRHTQPLLVLDRGARCGVAADERVRVLTPADLEEYLPAAAAMFTEELGVSPFVGPTGGTYRRRIDAMLASGRALGVVDGRGRIAFKADLGAVTRSTVQIQGVWTRPDLRGRGLGTAGLAAVLQHALRLAPTVSLYVNDFNTPARRMYDRLGMREVASLSTVLF